MSGNALHGEPGRSRRQKHMIPAKVATLARHSGQQGWGIASHGNWWVGAVSFGITIVLALFMGLLIATSQYLPLAVIGGAVVIVVATAVVVQFFGGRHDALFWLLLASVFFASVASAITRRPLTFLSTGILLAASPLILYCIIERIKWSRHALLLLALCAAFFLIAALSSALGRSRFFAGTYTAVLAIKPFLLVGCGAAFLWTRKSDRIFKVVVYWAWLPLMATAIIQWFFPSLYLAALADVESIPENNPMFPGFPRATGLFQHPSVLATTAAVFGLITIVDALLSRRVILASPSVVYAVLILMTGQRQELAAFVLCLPVLLIVWRYRLSFLALTFVLSAAFICLAGALYFASPSFIEQQIVDWQGAATDGTGSARAVLYHDAIRTANDYWPLGSGFGTFGSVGAIRFDQSFFLTLGYKAYWWFNKGKYLLDAYWAKYIGEVGWIGFAVHLMFYLVVLHAIIGWLNDVRVKADKKAERYALLGFVGLSYVLIASPTAFNLSEPHGGLVAMMFIGIAWQRVVTLRMLSANQLVNAGQSTHHRRLNESAFRYAKS